MTTPESSTISALTPIRFQFYSLRFTPYKESQISSNNILKEVFNYLMKTRDDKKGHLIDRHGDRENVESRELFMSSSVYMHKENRIRCTLALLRGGQKPMLKPKDKFILVPLNVTEHSIAEQTHFFIDYNKNYAVVCFPYNHNGPRISDLEYYLRNIAHDKLKLSKATEATLFMDASIDKVLADFKNSLNIDIKVQPRKLSNLDPDMTGQYFSGISLLGQRIKPHFIKLEAMFQTPGNTVKSKELNKEANKMVVDLLQRFKSKPINIDAFENFVVKYEDKEGNEEIFNLLKGKKEILKEVDLAKITSARKWYELIEADLNEFMDTL